MSRDALADRYGLAVEMGVAAGDAVAVVDLDDLAVIVAVTGIGHDAGCRRVDGRHVRRPQIDPGVIGRVAVDRIAAHSEGAAELIAFERCRNRQCLDQRAQRGELLRADRRGVLACRRRNERAAFAAVHPELREHMLDVDPGRRQHPLDLRKGAAIDGGHGRRGCPRRFGSSRFCGRRRGNDDGNLARRLGGWDSGRNRRCWSGRDNGRRRRCCRCTQDRRRGLGDRARRLAARQQRQFLFELVDAGAELVALANGLVALGA